MWAWVRGQIPERQRRKGLLRQHGVKGALGYLRGLLLPWPGSSSDAFEASTLRGLPWQTLQFLMGTTALAMSLQSPVDPKRIWPVRSDTIQSHGGVLPRFNCLVIVVDTEAKL